MPESMRFCIRNERGCRPEFYPEEQFKKREEIPPLMDGLTHKFEIVGLVRYLLSDATKFVTGQTFFLRTPK